MRTTWKVPVIVVVLVWACGCGRSVTGPSPVQLGGRPDDIATVRIHGPATVTPGVQQRFTATADRKRGDSIDVTATAAWRSSQPGVLLPESPGVFRARTRGESTITATIAGVSAEATVLVLEDGTFRLSGMVTDATTGTPLPQATVTVVEGVGASLSTRSDDLGRYRLYGVAGRIDIMATAPGFVPIREELVVSDHTARDFSVSAPTSTTEISGAWILSLSAFPSCRDALPLIARERQYAANITQQGAGFQLTLTGPTIVDARSDIQGRFQTTGVVSGGTVFFDILGDFLIPFWDVVEPLSGIGLGGVIRADINSTDIRGTMSGNIVHWNGDSETTCRANDHAVILRRSESTRTAPSVVDGS